MSRFHKIILVEPAIIEDRGCQDLDPVGSGVVDGVLTNPVVSDVGVVVPDVSDGVVDVPVVNPNAVINTDTGKTWTMERWLMDRWERDCLENHFDGGLARKKWYEANKFSFLFKG